MTKAYLVNHENVVIDETGKLSSLKTISHNIDWIYIAPEDMEMTYRNNDTQVTKQVKKGNIIIQMYNDPKVKDYQHVIVIDSEEWKNNLELYVNRYEYKEDNSINNYEMTCSPCVSNAE